MILSFLRLVRNLANLWEVVLLCLVLWAETLLVMEERANRNM